MNNLWPLSEILLMEILSDHVADNFVCKLIWERLGYEAKQGDLDCFIASLNTPNYWREKFPEAPAVIAKRSASVHLTRSIPKEYKQSLKKCLHFEGYLIGELFPRRTRRATAVNWLLAWGLTRKEKLLKDGPLPTLLQPPVNPMFGHPGDPPIE